MKTNEYLALLYVQSRDLRDKQPGDLLMLYRGALDAINQKEGDIFEKRATDALAGLGGLGGTGQNARS